MIFLLLKFILLSATIVVAGIFLAKYGDEIADISGLGGSLVGLILIAAATSLPELAVNCMAVRIPAPDLAVGAVVGSSLFNLLILGVMEFMHSSSQRIISPASRSHALAAVSSIALTSLVAYFILAGDRPVFSSIGIGPIVIGISYCYFLRLIYNNEALSANADADESPENRAGLARALLGYLAMTAVIFGAAWFLAPTADAIAEKTGLGGTFVGTTFVAISTSLPELVTTLAAVRMGSFDLAVGNVFGSNSFNAAMLVPIDWCYAPGALLQVVISAHAITALAVVIVTAVILAAMFSAQKRRVPLLDPGAGMVVIAAIIALVTVYFAAT